MDKDRLAEIFEEVAVLLELKGENPFKARAYTNAARTLTQLNEPLETLVKENRLGEVKGIGERIQEKIKEAVTTGRLSYYEELKQSVPEGLVHMVDIPGLGPKKAKAVYEKLGVASIEDLEKACHQDQIAHLEGFGQKTQSKILEGIEFKRKYASRHLVSDVLALAEPILASLQEHPEVIRCDIAGSLRRFKEVIGDVDFLVSAKKSAGVIDFFTQQPGVVSVSAKGDTKASVILEKGIQGDLRVVSDTQFPFALAYFTGSKEHNIVMRQRSIQRGMHLNEYGLFQSREETRDPKYLVPCRTEEEIFAKLDLQYIPPELREDNGEFEAAEKGKLPKLLEWTDLKGSLHNHSNWSDGRDSLEQIADHMESIGCDYWGITDHSKSSFQANGLSPERVRKQIKAVNEVNQRLKDQGKRFRLLTGSEVDILSHGKKLDFDDSLLAELDIVVASIHQGFSQSESEMTKRILTAVENRYVHMLGHLTGRLLLEREAYKVDQYAIIDACGETGTWIELNANPLRFDLDWRLWQYAKSKGVKCVINCDAHRHEHAGFLRLGAGIARKGWLTKKDVINTLPMKSLTKELQKKRSG